MRIDLLLVSLCLVKTRSRAQKGCNAGLIYLNGKNAKPSSEVQAGDRIELRYPKKILTVEVLELPTRRTSRKESTRFYRILCERKVEENRGWDE